jgi:hypothetical protein
MAGGIFVMWTIARIRQANYICTWAKDMNVGGIGEGSDLVSDWLDLCYLYTKILGEDRFGFRRGKESTAACVDLSFQTKNYLCLRCWFCLILLHVSAVYFSHNRLGILVYEGREKEEIFLPDDGRNKESKKSIELNKFNIKDNSATCFGCLFQP